jgi:uncharacterized protein involved in exopolysaccharide biosynthesis/Mrp family chromosome partitioning ATPase
MVFVVGVHAALSPDMYQSEAKIVLTGRKDSTVRMLTGVTVSNELNTEIALLRSRGFAGALVDRIGWHPLLAQPESREPEGAIDAVKYYVKLGWRGFQDLLSTVNGNQELETSEPDSFAMRQRAIEQFQSGLSVSSRPQTDVIDVTYESVTPELAQEILRDAIDLYLEKHLAINATPISLQRLTVETDKLREELQERRESLETYLDGLGEGSLDQQIQIAVARVLELQSQIEQTEAQISGARAAIRSTTGNIQLRQEERNAQIRLQTLAAELAVLRRQSGNAQLELEQLNASARRVDDLRQRVEESEEQFNRFRSRLEEARIAQTLESEEISNVSVMQNPTYDDRSTGSGMRIVMLAAVLAVVIALSIAFILEFLDHSIRTPEDTTARLGINTVVSLPILNKKRIRRLLRREIRKRQRESDSLTVVPMKLAEHVITWEYFLPDVRAAFDALRSFLLPNINGESLRPAVIAVTSCQRNEGVTTIAAGLASSVALIGGKEVLLVNANGHHPDADIVPGEFRPARLYEIDAREHMLLSTQDDQFLFQQSSDVSESDLPPKPNSLDRMLTTVQALNYRAVILDLPSLREGGTAFLHAARSDGTLIVVESERTKREVVDRARRRIEDAGGKVLGIVLNKRRFYIPRWLYSRS